MPYSEAKWDEEYNIGIEEIDRAHEEFFRILHRLQQLGKNPAKYEWVAKEGIKYLKQYALNHFAAEENFMRSIDYTGFDHHKYQHDVMRDKVLPKLEAHLRHDRYSLESIEKFLEIMRAWLGRHILKHDMALGWASEMANV